MSTRRDAFIQRLVHINPDVVTATLLFCGLLAFAPNLTGYFLADDFVLLSWTRVHTLNEVLGFFDPNVEWFYRPFVKLFYWVGQGVFGLRAAPFHVVSLLLHGANAYLVYRLVIGTGSRGGRWVVGLAAGLLFLLNSHHAETVSWIAAVGDLAGLFWVLTALLLFRRFGDTGDLRSLVGSVGVFALGLLTRETVVMLPVLLLADTSIFRRTPTAKGNVARIGRLIGGLAAYGAVLTVYLAMQILGRGGTAGHGGLQFRVLHLDSILLGVMDYVHGLMPGGKALAALPLDTLRTVVWLEVLSLLVFAAILAWKRQRLALFGLAWMVTTPLLFVFFSGPTDRYFYLPSVGYALLASGLVGWLAQFMARRGQNVPSPLARAARAGGAILLGAMLLTQARDLAAKEGAWRAAGMVSGGVFNDLKIAVPSPRDGALFSFVGLPPFMEGVPAFQNALPQAVQLIYNNSTLFAAAVKCEELQGQPKGTEYHIFMFKGDGVRELGGEGCR